jgi:hypothetical protein
LTRVGGALVNVDITISASQHIAFNGVFINVVVKAVAAGVSWVADTAVPIVRNFWVDV